MLVKMINIGFEYVIGTASQAAILNPRRVASR